MDLSRLLDVVNSVGGYIIKSTDSFFDVEWPRGKLRISPNQIIFQGPKSFTLNYNPLSLKILEYQEIGFAGFLDWLELSIKKENYDFTSLKRIEDIRVWLSKRAFDSSLGLDVRVYYEGGKVWCHCLRRDGVFLTKFSSEFIECASNQLMYFESEMDLASIFLLIEGWVLNGLPKGEPLANRLEPWFAKSVREKAHKFKMSEIINFRPRTQPSRSVIQETRAQKAREVALKALSEKLFNEIEKAAELGEFSLLPEEDIDPGVIPLLEKEGFRVTKKYECDCGRFERVMVLW